MRRFILLALLFVAPVVLSVHLEAQSKHPFTFEDMMKLKRVAEPVPSPDGKWVAFSVVDVSLEANTKTPHVWIVPTAGGESREIIADQDADRPRWSPDGKRFLFLSSKGGGQQVWIADFDSATATVTATHRFTSLATEADGPIWSPDGKNIVFVSSVFPECVGSPAEGAACNAKKLDEVAKSKVKAQVFTRLLYRHWNAYQEGKRSHLFVVAADAAAEDNTPRDLTPGDYDSPVFSLGGQDNYVIAPDGQELCYTSNHDKVEATSTNNDLWIVPINATTPNVATGASPVSSSQTAKNITADNPASDSTPLYSSDGKYIAYRAQKRPGYESDQFRLMLYNRKTGEKKNLTEDFDRWIGTIAWNLDSPAVLFSGDNFGEAPVYMIGVDDKKPRVMVGGYNDDLSVVPNDGRLLFTRMSLTSPNEIYGTTFSGRSNCPVDHGFRDQNGYTVDRCDTFIEKPSPTSTMPSSPR